MSLQYLAPDSRVWVFLADRILSEAEYQSLNTELKGFVSDWKAHGDDLSAGFEIRNHSAVVVAVDESITPPSGCSIDKVFRLLQQFGANNQLDFFNRMLLIVQEDPGVVIMKKADAINKFKKGDLNANSLVFNPLVNNLSTYQSGFVIPFTDHWLGKELQK
jgi:hypothetical protein